MWEGFIFGEFLCVLLFCFKVLALIIIRPEIQHEYDDERTGRIHKHLCAQKIDFLKLLLNNVQ